MDNKLSKYTNSKISDEKRQINREKEFFYGNSEKKLDFYHINTTIFKDVFPVDVGYEKHSAGKRPFNNKYPYLLLHFVLSGKGIIEIDGKQTLLKKNTIFILPSAKEITYIFDKKSNWEYCWVNFNGTAVKKILNYLSITETEYFLPIKNRKETEQCFKTMLEAKNNKISQYFTVMRCLMQLFAIISEENAKAKQTSSAKENTFSLVFEYINDNVYSTELTAKSVAERFFITPCWFSTIFARNMNTSFKEYVNYERVKKATELLDSSDLLIKEIAESVGFTDQLYFGKVFKRYRLVSPQEYRKSKNKLR